MEPVTLIVTFFGIFASVATILGFFFQWQDRRALRERLAADASATPGVRPKTIAEHSRWRINPLVPLAGLSVVVLIGIGLFILSQTANPSRPSHSRMINIASGAYVLGLDPADANHVAAHTITLNGYWIDQYEVTNSDYASFLNTHRTALPSKWIAGTMPPGKEQFPVEGVDWAAASDYCKAAKKRLPTEAEWEVAARGPQAWKYPWGNELSVVKLSDDAPYPVGSVALNKSPFGGFDFAGNVWEWVDQPYGSILSNNKVLRGGSYGLLKDMAYRLPVNPAVPTSIANAGFRCALDASVTTS